MSDERLEAILSALQPTVVENQTWTRPLRISCYLGHHELPVGLCTSIRVLVQVGDSIVIGTNNDGTSTMLPGGRVEPGETWVETGCREVHEETGWILDPASFIPLGFMHLLNRGEPNPPYPHPHVLWPVFAATGVELEAEGWCDTEGYVVSSRLVPLSQVTLEAVGTLSWCYLEAFRATI